MHLIQISCTILYRTRAVIFGYLKNLGRTHCKMKINIGIGSRVRGIPFVIFSCDENIWKWLQRRVHAHVVVLVLRIHDILVWIQGNRIRIWIRGSMPLTNGSGFGSGSGCGSGSCYFVIDLQDANKKIFFYNFFCLILFEGTFTSFSKIKSQEKTQSSKNQGFSYYFCLVIEGSGTGSGSIHLTNGSGSGSRRPKNMWIRWSGSGFWSGSATLCRILKKKQKKQAAFKIIKMRVVQVPVTYLPFQSAHSFSVRMLPHLRVLFLFLYFT
jgi:hypothetical protein